MEAARIQNGQSEILEIMLTDFDNNPITGATIDIKIRRQSDDYFLDWSDMTFKTTGWASITVAMNEIDASNAPGKYKKEFNTSGYSDDTYQITAEYSSGNIRKQFVGELKVGDYVDNIDKRLSMFYKDNEKRTFYIATSDISARNVQAGQYDKEKVEIKDPSDSDWNSPIDTFWRYYWYASMGDEQPEKVTGESS